MRIGIWRKQNSHLYQCFTIGEPVHWPNISLCVFFFFCYAMSATKRYRENRTPDQTDEYPISEQKGELCNILFQTRNVRKWYPLWQHIPICLTYGSTPHPQTLLTPTEKSAPGSGSSKPDQANPGLVKFFFSIYDPANCNSVSRTVRLVFNFSMQAFW